MASPEAACPGQGDVQWQRERRNVKPKTRHADEDYETRDSVLRKSVRETERESACCFWGTTRRGNPGLIHVSLKSVEFLERSRPSSPEFPDAGRSSDASPITMPMKRNRPSRNDQRQEDRQAQGAGTMALGPYGNPPIRLPTRFPKQAPHGQRFDRVPAVFSDPFRRAQVGAMNVYIAKFIACVKTCPVLVQAEQPASSLSDRNSCAPWNCGFQSAPFRNLFSAHSQLPAKLDAREHAHVLPVHETPSNGAISPHNAPVQSGTQLRTAS